ncbi:MAG: hypothetical protein GY710_16885 [Desulfobacteraceae bacterium]|nr:hypothetical protein [Desulfobacteraceae bacterium]
MANRIFRQKSLETLSSPERLDQVIQVIKPLLWIGLLACFLLISIVVFWGIKGEIQTVVNGQGILFKENSIYDVISLGTGQIKNIYIQVDDNVAKGQVMALLSLPNLDYQLKEAKGELEHLEAKKKMIGKQSSALEFKISQIRLEIKNLKETYNRQSRIISPHKGKVL